jgi:hypothetical protein
MDNQFTMDGKRIEGEVKQPESVTTSMANVPRVLLEILIYGTIEDKDKLNQFMEDFQEQIKFAKQNRRVRLLFYIDKGELSSQAKEEWLINNSVCKYYLMVNPKNPESDFKGYVVPKDFVKNCMKNIKTFEESYSKMKTLGVKIKK